jgi:signal transduction histidine kinase
MAAVTTPMDAELAELNRKVGKTVVGYGSERARRFVSAKQVASEAAPASVAADRLSFNAAYGVAVQGEGELLDELKTGKAKLESVKKDQLPAEWQKLSDAELKAEIEKKQRERSELQAQIQKLSKEREDYIAQERKRLAADGKTDSFDSKVAETLKDQASRKGIAYEK